MIKNKIKILRDKYGHSLIPWVCGNCGVRETIRSDRPRDLCKSCRTKGFANPMYGKAPHNKGRGTYVRRELRLDRKKEYILLKGNRCAKCGVSGLPMFCYDFHHKDGEVKHPFAGQILVWSKKRALEELEKCDLLCANCHRSVHHGDNSVMGEVV